VFVGAPAPGSQAVARLQQAAPVAAATMLKLMLDPNKPASVRARAAAPVQWPNGRDPRWLRPRAATPSTSCNTRLSWLSFEQTASKDKGLRLFSRNLAA
jgi:hypothetical protein